MACRKSNQRDSLNFSKSRSGRGRNSQSGYRPQFEQLEPRMMLSTTTVIGNGGDWHDPSTWNNGVPTAADDAVVPAGKVLNFDGAAHVAKTLRIQGTATLVPGPEPLRSC